MVLEQVDIQRGKKTNLNLNQTSYPKLTKMYHEVKQKIINYKNLGEKKTVENHLGLELGKVFLDLTPKA